LTVPLPPAPRYGEHTVECLEAAGVTDVPGLVEAGVAATSWCKRYLPAAVSPPPRRINTTATMVADSTDATTDALPPLLASEQCPICLGVMEQPMVLTCSHALCTTCATVCSASGHSRCPVCRHPHLLDPKLLNERREKWRAAYGGWRRGACSGAVGEVASIVTPRRSKSDRGHDGHSFCAGDLAHAAVATRRVSADGDALVKRGDVAPKGMCRAAHSFHVLASSSAEGAASPIAISPNSPPTSPGAAAPI